jgi:hypothetical protein
MLYPVLLLIASLAFHSERGAKSRSLSAISLIWVRVEGFATIFGSEMAVTVMKAISLSGSIQRRQIETEIENLLNLRHPMIASLIGWRRFSRFARGIERGAGIQNHAIIRD